MSNKLLGWENHIIFQVIKRLIALVSPAISNWRNSTWGSRGVTIGIKLLDYLRSVSLIIQAPLSYSHHAIMLHFEAQDICQMVSWYSGSPGDEVLSQVGDIWTWDGNHPNAQMQNNNNNNTNSNNNNNSSNNNSNSNSNNNNDDNNMKYIPPWCSIVKTHITFVFVVFFVRIGQ